MNPDLIDAFIAAVARLGAAIDAHDQLPANAGGKVLHEHRLELEEALAAVEILTARIDEAGTA